MRKSSTTTMYQDMSSQPGSLRGPYATDGRPGYSHEQHSSYGGPSSRPFDLPRPLEPQPTRHFSHSYVDGPGAQRPYESFGRLGNGLSEPRNSGPSLPGVRDLLHPAPAEHHSPSYAAPWTPSHAPPVGRVAGEAYYHQSGLHPPLALPSHPPEQRGHGQQAEHRRMELPILETHPIGRQPAPPPPASPYHYTEPPRDYMEARGERPRQASTSSYSITGVTSPYTPGSVGDSYNRAPPPTFDRNGSTVINPAPEIQRKYLGIHKVPGEGEFHVYEGGYRTPTHVDGDYVNPQWGLTKANKPRKRLAMACLDCREKKIKCEPGQNACLQCEKSKRVCRRAPNTAGPPQPGETTPNPTWSASTATPTRPHGNDRISDPNPKSSAREGEPDSAKRRVRDELIADGGLSKKHRSASPMLLNEQFRSEPKPKRPYQGFESVSPSETSEPMRSGLAVDVDPCFAEHEAAMHLLELYFDNVNSATYAMFPRRATMRWAQNCHSKCQNEIMILYAMLAMGSIFADSSFSGLGRKCAVVAAEVVSSKHGRFSLPLVQSRLLLGLYNFAKGKEGAAWDYCGSAIRALSGLNFNLERDCHDDSAAHIHSRREFDFTSEQLTECKRRTFWAGFLMDRYNGFCGGTLCMVNPEDIFVRLPCDDETYERGTASQAPKYNNGITAYTETILTAESPVAPMAWLCLISALWGEVMTFIYRAQNRPSSDPTGYREAYESFYQEKNNAMQGWYTRLPHYLTYSEENLDRSIQQGFAGTFISIHALYHFTQVKLNRCVRHALVPELVPRNIRTAHAHAQEFLQIMCAVGAARREITQPFPGQCPVFTFTTPFPGYAILCAVDVVGAGGLDSNLGATLDTINGALACLRELKQFWSSAKGQSKSAEKRGYQIQNIVKNPVKAKSGCWLGRSWGVEKALALDTDFPPKDDCIYGVESQVYFDALRDGQLGSQRERPSTNGLRLV